MIDSDGKVFLVDDNKDVRHFLADFLRQLGYVVEDFEDAAAFLLNAAPSGPAVLVVDMRMPGMSGHELQLELQHRQWPLPLVFISGESNTQEIIDSMKAGAIEFLCKPFDKSKLLSAIGHGLALDRKRLAQQVKNERLQELLAQLSPREVDIMPMLLQGQTNKQIGDGLGTAASTVKKHKANILDKFGLDSQSALIALFQDSDLFR